MIDKNGEKKFESLHVHVYILIYAYMLCLIYVLLLNILIVYAMHELRGSFMKLNFNPCIYNFMSFVITKKGEIVSPKVHHSSLMMINSCSYSTNDLVFI